MTINLLQFVTGWVDCKEETPMEMSDNSSRELALSSIPEIRRIWHKNEWYYSVIDVIAFLTRNRES
jgi:hypothetical protein